MIYQKSELGHKEFESQKRSLSVRDRQVLLLVNGSRNMDDLEKFFKREHLLETLEKLKSGEFIQLLSSSAPASATLTIPTPLAALSFFSTENAITVICPTKMAAIKTILIDAADDYLGLMGRSIKGRIEKCDDEAELRSCVSGWHMAMRESKLGRESTDFLMKQIHQVLENETQAVAGIA